MAMDIARKGAPKKVLTTFETTRGMHERTNTTLGAPPHPGVGPDASSELPTDPTKQHGSKQFPKPAIHDGMRGHAALDINDGSAVLSEAVKSGSTKLPATVKED